MLLDRLDMITINDFNISVEWTHVTSQWDCLKKFIRRSAFIPSKVVVADVVKN